MRPEEGTRLRPGEKFLDAQEGVRSPDCQDHLS